MPYPPKTRDLHSFQFNSTIWDDLQHRDDDIVIATYAKSGTTWMQQIVSQLIFDGAEDIEVARLSPWLDRRQEDMSLKLKALEAQSHRRFIKTHLPRDAVSMVSNIKYIFVARDGRDVIWSLHNHHKNSLPEWYQLVNDTPGLVGPKINPPPDSVVEYFRDWMAGDGYPWHSFWETIRTWWQVCDHLNVLAVHYADLKADLAGEVNRIADFLDIHPDPETLARVIHHCSFDYMRARGQKTVPGEGVYFKQGVETFINKGINGRWREMLSADESAAYEARAIAELGEECARWLAR